MKPSDVIMRRALEKCAGRAEAGAGFRVKTSEILDVTDNTLIGVLHYLDELHARGVIPLPSDPNGPWKPVPPEAGKPVPPEAGKPVPPEAGKPVPPEAG